MRPYSKIHLHCWEASINKLMWPYFKLFFLPQPNSTQTRVGFALFFLWKPQPQTTTKPYPTLSQLLHNQTRPNSACNLISTQLEDLVIFWLFYFLWFSFCIFGKLLYHQNTKRVLLLGKKQKLNTQEKILRRSQRSPKRLTN